MRLWLLCAALALEPLFDYIASPIPGFDFGSLFYLITLVINFSHLNRSSLLKIRATILIFYFLYVVLFSPICFVLFGSQSEISEFSPILRFLKYALLVGTFLLLDVSNMFPAEYFFKISVIFTVFNSVYVCIQQVFIQFGLVIPNMLAGVMGTSYVQLSQGSLFRPSGLFAEPSHYAQYVLPVLAGLLFSRFDFPNKKLVTFTACAGLLASGSGMGIIGLFLLMAVFFLANAKKRILYFFYGFSLLIIASLIFSGSDFGAGVLARLFTDGSTVGGNAFFARIGHGYEEFISHGPLELVLGSGYGNVGEFTYQSGIEYALNAVGLVGLTMYAAGFVQFSAGSVTACKVVLLCYFALMFGCQLLSAPGLIYFLTLAICFNKIDSLKRIDAENE